MEFQMQNGLGLTEEERTMLESSVLQAASLKGETVEFVKVWEDGEGYLAYQPYYHRDVLRVRRITGYFSEIKNFNDAKRAELADRTTHL
jgi:hypothetical protein